MAGDWKASNQPLTQIRRNPSKEGIFNRKVRQEVAKIAKIAKG